MNRHLLICLALALLFPVSALAVITGPTTGFTGQEFTLTWTANTLQEVTSTGTVVNSWTNPSRSANILKTTPGTYNFRETTCVTITLPFTGDFTICMPGDTHQVQISARSAPPLPTGFAAGTFEPYENFAQMCANPRFGVDADGRTFPDVQGTTEDENNWLRSWSNELYLWYDEITDVDPASLSTSRYFARMRTFEMTPSGARKDRFHFTYLTDEWQARSRAGVSSGYGAELAILQSRPPRQIVVAYTEPNTPATSPEVNLQRGAELLEIDGVDVVNGDDVATLNRGLFPRDDETHTFLIRDAGATETRTITMTSTRITSTPVQNVRMLETDSGLVGYLTFNSHIRPSEAQLIDAITRLRAANIADLVLDLRYNGGGLLDIANELAFMVAGDNAAGQVFEELLFNDKHPDFNPVTGARLQASNYHTTSLGFSGPAGRPLPRLGLDRVFVLSGAGTCSASEAIINGLRGIDVEVVLIGETTCGKPYGFYPFDNCGTTYFSTQFRTANQKGFGDYGDGFSPMNTPRVEGTPIPGCLVSDDFMRPLGDPEEGRLRAALQYREDGSCPTVIAGSNLAAARATSEPNPQVTVGRNDGLQNRIMTR